MLLKPVITVKAQVELMEQKTNFTPESLWVNLHRRAMWEKYSVYWYHDNTYPSSNNGHRADKKTNSKQSTCGYHKTTWLEIPAGQTTEI